MAQSLFANSGTQIKLETVFKYAEFYTDFLSTRPSTTRPFRLHYLDAFAGTGDIPYANEMPLLEGIEDSDLVISGSAKRALEVTKPFRRYVFSEKQASKATQLRTFASSYPNLNVEIYNEDANLLVPKFCKSLGPSDRALMFLDPFGNQVHWSTLEAIAQCERVDLWYLFPAWIGVVRQIKGDGSILPDAEASIDKMFGPHDWRSNCVSNPKPSSQPYLFDKDSLVSEKIASADTITKYMIDCMNSIFKGGVSASWLRCGRSGRHYYSLIFACANPSDKAKNVAHRVANHFLKNRRRALARLCVVETPAILARGGELPMAYWRLLTPLKNVAHGPMRT